MWGRIIGGFIVGLVTFGLLNWPINRWYWSSEIKIVISVVLGLIFMFLGGKIWKWLYEISLWR